MNDVEGYVPVYGGTIPATIWHNFMSTATDGMPALGFPTPNITGAVTYGSGYSTTPPAPTQTVIDVQHNPVPPPPKGGH